MTEAELVKCFDRITETLETHNDTLQILMNQMITVELQVVQILQMINRDVGALALHEVKQHIKEN